MLWCGITCCGVVSRAVVWYHVLHSSTMASGYRYGGPAGYSTAYPVAAAATAAYYDRFGGYSMGAMDYGSTYTDYAAPKKRKVMKATICVDHLRGICTRGPRCDQLHADHIPDIEDREELAKGKFCHDFQNRGTCSRSTCRFLHVTRSEEDEFLLTGNISPAIFKRSRERAQTVDASSYGSFGSEKTGNTRPDYYQSFNPTSQYQQYGGQYSGYYGYQQSQMTSWGGDADGGRTRKRRSTDGGKDNYSFSQPVTVSNYCIDHLKSNCSKGKDCRLEHADVIQEKSHREAIVKSIFCHDFLNKRCPRNYCKYIHANYDEQKFFLEQGYFSDSLSARNKSKLFFCDICIDYLRGQCTRGSSCQHRHVDRVENRDERICLSRSIFCHDFQEGVCNRTICKLYHTGKGDEELFIETGCLPEHLSNKITAEPTLEELAETSCRDFLKGVCYRGVSCKYYHPSKEESRRIMSYHRAKRMGGVNASQTNSSASAEPIDHEENCKYKKANEELQQRIARLESLLAEACHCLTVAVGNDDPTAQNLVQAISNMNGDAKA